MCQNIVRCSSVLEIHYQVRNSILHCIYNHMELIYNLENHMDKVFVIVSIKDNLNGLYDGKGKLYSYMSILKWSSSK